MDISQTIAEMKQLPGFSDHVGMILAHNGVVRGWSRTDGSSVRQVDVCVDACKAEQIRTEIEQMPGIFKVELEARSGVLSPGDDLLFLVVAGDIREHVKPALAGLLERVKAEAVSKKEHFEEGALRMLNHFDAQGQAIMVDVSGKQKTMRTAIASSAVTMKPALLQQILDGQTSKGDVLAVARLAGINASKKTPDLIPLSHPLSIHYASIEFKTDVQTGTVMIAAEVRAFERTGVEMEAMVAASVAALTVYDMCKGADKGITISATQLEYKEGGKSGVFRRQSDEDCS